MSSATSKRARKARDWSALVAAVRADDDEARAHGTKGRWRDTSHGIEYIDALQEALEGRKAERLLAMLDAQCPIPDCLLPVLAEVIRDARQGRSTGQPKALTEISDAVIREYFDLMVNHMGLTAAAARDELASIKGVSLDTIKRSLRRTVRKQ